VNLHLDGNADNLESSILSYAVNHEGPDKKEKAMMRSLVLFGIVILCISACTTSRHGSGSAKTALSLEGFDPLEIRTPVPTRPNVFVRGTGNFVLVDQEPIWITSADVVDGTLQVSWSLAMSSPFTFAPKGGISVVRKEPTSLKTPECQPEGTRGKVYTCTFSPAPSEKAWYIKYAVQILDREGRPLDVLDPGMVGRM
jgi:hypothetical protein